MKTYGYSNIGTHNANNNEENQDFSFSEELNNYEVIALADGVSSCSKAREGAEISAKAIAFYLLKNAEFLLDFPDEEQRNKLIVDCVMKKLKEKANYDGMPVEEYSSTLSAVLFDKTTNKALTFNLGSNMIMALYGDKTHIVGMPGDNRYGTIVTTTKGASYEASSHIIDTVNSDIQAEDFIMFTDGAWKALYSGTRPIPEVQTLLMEKRFDLLQQFLQQKNPFDDNSFINLNIKEPTLSKDYDVEGRPL